MIIKLQPRGLYGLQPRGLYDPSTDMNVVIRSKYNYIISNN